MQFDNGPAVVLGVVLGILGFGYLSYGRKLQKLVPLGCGVGLLVLPYCSFDTRWLIVIGSALGLAPWVIR